MTGRHESQAVHEIPLCQTAREVHLVFSFHGSREDLVADKTDGTGPAGTDPTDNSAGAGDARGQTTRSRDPFTADHYLVHVPTPGPRTVDILARHHIDAGDVYRISSWGFAAHLHPDKAAELIADPDITVEPDTAERAAPHHRVPADQRVPGSYIISVRRTSRPETVAERAGVRPDSIFTTINSFAANLTDAQLHTLLHDPEVDSIEDDQKITLDD